MIENIYNILRQTDVGEKIPASETIDKQIYRFIVNEREIVRTGYGSNMYINKHELGISRQLFRDGVTQPALTKYFSENIDEGMNIIDVGSHIGYFTILFAKLTGENGHVDAFEPIVENFNILAKNVELNSFDRRVSAYNQAIWDESGTKNLDISEHQMSGSVSESGREIEVTPLGEVVNHTVDMLKIDVDGGEESVLRGSTDIIEQCQPTIVLEYNPLKWKQSFEQIRDTYLSQYTNLKIITKDQSIIDAENVELPTDKHMTDVIVS